MLPAANEARARPRIGRFLITGRLGRGGMGLVYRGLDEALEREVAVKTITAQGTTTEESQKRFEIEAKAAARMQHPNIVAVYELGEDRGVKYIAMELLRGTDLDVLLRSGEEILLAEKIDVAIQVCRGLAYAHERGVFHRDIKPPNIGLLEDGTAKIMDFGIAKLEGTDLTKTGMMVGTVNYMSPEQVHGKKLDGRTDIFSMGVILYQMLAGERPFQGDSVTQVLYKIAKEPPPPLDLSSLGEIGPRLGLHRGAGARQGPRGALPDRRQAGRRPAGGPRRAPAAGRGVLEPRGPRGPRRRPPQGAGGPRGGRSWPSCRPSWRRARRSSRLAGSCGPPCARGRRGWSPRPLPPSSSPSSRPRSRRRPPGWTRRPSCSPRWWRPSRSPAAAGASSWPSRGPRSVLGAVGLLHAAWRRGGASGPGGGAGPGPLDAPGRDGAGGRSGLRRGDPRGAGAAVADTPEGRADVPQGRPSRRDGDAPSAAGPGAGGLGDAAVGRLPDPGTHHPCGGDGYAGRRAGRGGDAPGDLPRPRERPRPRLLSRRAPSRRVPDRRRGHPRGGRRPPSSRCPRRAGSRWSPPIRWTSCCGAAPWPGGPPLPGWSCPAGPRS